MKKYLCIMRSKPANNEKCEAPSPTDMEAMFAKFNAWKEEFKDNIIDMGGKLADGKVVTSEKVIDGPFAETNEIAGGFMIVAAEDIEKAVLVAQKSPGVYPGSSVEVREINQP
ncbi:MAG: hypothetical protein KUG78_19980 [Kangiellaceae bacterium]|nr:hypothetical protein [Kangiellaceae bacterium]